MIRYLGDDERELARPLYEEAFEDGKAFVDYYFSSYIRGRSMCLVEEESGQVVSMISIHQKRWRLQNGTSCQVWYLYGIATRQDCQRQGHMRRLMERVLADGSRKGIAYIYLIPENPAVYEGLGFRLADRGWCMEADLKNLRELCETQELSGTEKLCEVKELSGAEEMCEVKELLGAEKLCDTQELSGAEKPCETQELSGTEKPCEVKEQSGVEKPCEVKEQSGVEKPYEVKELLGAEKLCETQELLGAEKLCDTQELLGAEKLCDTQELSGVEKPCEVKELSGAEEMCEVKELLGAEKLCETQEQSGTEKPCKVKELSGTEKPCEVQKWCRAQGAEAASDGSDRIGLYDRLARIYDAFCQSRGLDAYIEKDAAYLREQAARARLEQGDLYLSYEKGSLVAFATAVLHEGVCTVVEFIDMRVKQDRKPAQDGEIYQHRESMQDGEMHQHGEPVQDGEIYQYGEPVQDGEMHQRGESVQDGEMHQRGEPVQDGEMHQHGEPVQDGEIYQHRESVQSREVNAGFDIDRYGKLLELAAIMGAKALQYKRFPVMIYAGTGGGAIPDCLGSMDEV